MAKVLLSTDPRFLDHLTGAHHPERPARLEAVLAGIAALTTGLTRRDRA
jgi:hypothetical protein